ncbi:hypothetical protein, partial [Klebsiella pneumoniae]|uniref:hypothetical protein n=1 Tax=Klebsiella pneumoniae TaxID=573 RepID=UPI0039C312FA
VYRLKPGNSPDGTVELAVTRLQLVHTPQHTQLSLFEAFMAQPLVPILKETVEAPWSAEPEAFSELSLRGAAGSCLS